MNIREEASTHITLSIYPNVMYLMALIGDYRKTYRNGLLDAAFPMTDSKRCQWHARRIVLAMIEECVTSRLRWVGGSVSSEAAIREVIADYGTEDSHNRSESLRRWVFEPTLNLLFDQVSQIVPDRSWYMWSVAALGDDVIFEQGEDFRVVEWERAVHEKKLSYPHLVDDDGALVNDAIEDLAITKRSPEELTRIQVEISLRHELDRRHRHMQRVLPAHVPRLPHMCLMERHG